MDYARQVSVWQAIGMLMELCSIEERPAFVCLCERATTREMSLVELATKMSLRQELP
jgi:AmiR/NasT family two-component response regulator